MAITPERIAALVAAVDDMEARPPASGPYITLNADEMREILSALVAGSAAGAGEYEKLFALNQEQATKIETLTADNFAKAQEVARMVDIQQEIARLIEVNTAQAVQIEGLQKTLAEKEAAANQPDADLGEGVGSAD